MKKTSIGYVVLPISLFLAGCGTAEYQSRLDKAVSGTSSTSKFSSALGQETTIPGTSISLRIPTAMQSVDIADALRGKCPLFDISGLKATYEGSVEDQAKNKLQYYLYIAVSDQNANNFIPARNWLAQMQGDFPDSPDSSTEINNNYLADSPEGSPIHFEEFHYNKCLQKFLYPTPTKPDNSQKMPGNIVCLSHTENGKVVSLVFRYPSGLSDYHGANFDPDWLKLVAGTLKVGASGG